MWFVSHVHKYIVCHLMKKGTFAGCYRYLGYWKQEVSSSPSRLRSLTSGCRCTACRATVGGFIQTSLERTFTTFTLGWLRGRVFLKKTRNCVSYIWTEKGSTAKVLWCQLVIQMMKIVCWNLYLWATLIFKNFKLILYY